MEENKEKQTEQNESNAAKRIRMLGEEIAEDKPVDEKEIDKVGNFWYHHKWKVIIIGFFTFVILTASIQFFSRQNPDVNLMYSGPDYMPQGHDDKDPIVSQGLVRMLMKLMIDLSTELGENGEKIPVWQHILDHLPQPDTFERQGEPILRGIAGSTELRELALECMYPVGQIGRSSTPELFRVAGNTHRQLAIWDSNNRFCSYYPMAARLGYPAREITGHIHEAIEKHGLPNGMFRFEGGGLENSAAIPTTVCEMLLQTLCLR